MKKGRHRGKWIALLAASVFAAGLIFGGCGSDQDPMRIAFVGDTESGEYQGACGELWDGISDYLNDHNAEAENYVPADTSVSAGRDAMEKAIDAGADVIVCVGEQMGNAVYDLQQRENHTQFVLVDALPTDGTGESRERIRGNTYCIRINREEAGFLAGYAAVMDGSRTIGYLGGSREEENVKYGSGFIQGAEYAGASQKLGDGAITVMYGLIPSDAVDPAQVAEINGWFQEGCQIISVSGNGPEFIGIESAKESGGKIITADMNHSELDSEVVAAASGINYTKVARLALQQVQNGTLKGGEITEYGIKENGVRMAFSDTGFENFTVQQYSEVVKQIKSGEIRITGKDVSKNPEKNGITICKIENK
ncbi:MAG: BMP family lipoprotein [Bilifractor sp.]